jgi:hypothetical protein
MFGRGFVRAVPDTIDVIRMGVIDTCIVQYAKRRGILTRTKNAPQKIKERSRYNA